MGTGAVAAMGVALAASKDIGIAAVPPFDKAIAFVFMLAIAVSWIGVPVLIYFLDPTHFDQYLNPVITFLHKHGGQLMATVFFVIGAYLLIRGASSLTTLYSAIIPISVLSFFPPLWAFRISEL